MTTTVGSRTGLQPRIGGPYSYRPLGYQQITSLSAATLLAPPAGATMALINVSGAAIRYRDDGVAPTSSLGMPVGTNEQFQYSGDLTGVEFIQQGSSATLDILYYM